MLKVELRGRFDAVGLVAEENLVQIQLQNEVFVVSAGNFGSNDDLLQLAGGRNGRVLQDQIARHLLCDRARARFDPSGAQILEEGAHNRNRVPAGVLKIALIFDRHDCIDHLRRDLSERDIIACATLRAGQFGDQTAVRRQDACGAELRLIIRQPRNRLTIRFSQTVVVQHNANRADRAQ